jgi:hypothetical protein
MITAQGLLLASGQQTREGLARARLRYLVSGEQSLLTQLLEYVQPPVVHAVVHVVLTNHRYLWQLGYSNLAGLHVFQCFIDPSTAGEKWPYARVSEADFPGVKQLFAILDP